MRSNTEAVQLLEQLLRQQPRNQLVIDVCEELRDRIAANRVAEPGKTFDKTAYQREYMKAWRARRKPKHG
jgi:predicted Zn-dependent protease